MANPYAPAQVDFSSLANMGQNIGGTIGTNNFNNAMGTAVGPDGNFDYNKAMSILADRKPDLAMKLASGIGQGGASVYGTPIPYRKPDGTIGMGALGKDGSWHEVPMPGSYVQGTKLEDFGGYKQPYQYGAPTSGPTPVTGSPPQGYVPPQQDVTRAGVGPTGGYMPGTSPVETAQAGVEGKAQGENVALLKSMQAKLPGLLQTVDKLGELGDKATYTTGGQVYDLARKELGMEPRDAAVARTEYMATVDNQVLPLLRDTFGAAFTVEEGKSLRATLGDANKSPKEKQAVLRSFINQKMADIAALNAQVGGQMPNTTNAVRNAPTAPAMPPGVSFTPPSQQNGPVQANTGGFGGGAPQQRQIPVPANINGQELQLFRWANEAIANGANPAAVEQRLIEMGVKP